MTSTAAIAGSSPRPTYPDEARAALLRAANINPRTGLATDYLNHFNEAIMLVLPGGAIPGIGPSATDGSVSLHLVTAALFAAAFGIAGFLAQFRFATTKVTVTWAAAAVFTPVALLVALYARIAHLDRSIPFAILAVLLAAAYAAATEALTRRGERPELSPSIALSATGALASLALALTFALDKGWLTIALALVSMGTAWLSVRRPIPFLRWLAAILAGIVMLRIGYEPRIAGDAVGTTPIFNWLLWGYGVPALSFWAASHFLRRSGDDVPLRIVEAAAILFTVLLAFMPGIEARAPERTETSSGFLASPNVLPVSLPT